MPDAPRVAVIGGGIAGLATAWYLRQGAGPPQVTVLEADSRLGGKLRTLELAGVPVEAGPDTFLARVPWATELCRNLGLDGHLVAPATGRAYVWARERLRPIPAGQVLGVPTAFGPLLRSGVLTAPGAARAALDLILPRSPFPDDPSVAEVVGRRLGPEALDVLVDPLVGGINAGRADRLSLASTAPQLAAGSAHRSLIVGLRRQRAGTDSVEGPLFLGVAGGMGRLVDRLRDSLDECDARTSVTVRSLERTSDGRYKITCASGPEVAVDAVVLAVPAFAASDILKAIVPAGASELAAIAYASVVVATLAYRPSAVRRPLDGSGFLVPRGHRWLTTACTWSTSKWPDLGRSGLVIMRASAGRFRDERALALDDDTLAARLHDELDLAVGLADGAVATLVTRWPRAFPQYEPGHEARVSRIEKSLGQAPGVFVTGAAYRGLGIAACVRDAEETAGRVQDHLTSAARRSGS